MQLKKMLGIRLGILIYFTYRFNTFCINVYVIVSINLIFSRIMQLIRLGK